MTNPLSMLARSRWIGAVLLCTALTACGGDGADSGGQGPLTPSSAGQNPNQGGGNQPNQPPAAKPVMRCAP